MVALDQIRNFDLGFQNIQKKIRFLLPQNYKFFHKSMYIPCSIFLDIPREENHYNQKHVELIM